MWVQGFLSEVPVVHPSAETEQLGPWRHRKHHHVRLRYAPPSRLGATTTGCCHRNSGLRRLDLPDIVGRRCRAQRSMRRRHLYRWDDLEVLYCFDSLLIGEEVDNCLGKHES
jgi:hypothetical protein